MRFLIIFISALLLSFSIEAQNVADNQRVKEAVTLAEEWLKADLAYERIPGLSVAVVNDQEVVWKAGFGNADPEQKVPATSKTNYSICSISKLFTSIAIMQLRDKGLLELNDTLHTLLPWFNLEQAHEGSGPITVEGILTHSAGLPRESNHPYWTGPDFPFPEKEEIIQGLEEQKTLYPSAQYFQYSNLGMTLAGEVVAELTGKTYEEYIEENILNPLGLDQTYTFMPDEEEDDLARGYTAMRRSGEREEVALFDAKGITAAAGFSSTVEDLAQFASWQFRVLEEGSDQVLQASTLREMQRVHYMDPGWNTSWGLGFSVFQRDGSTFVGHGGSCPGYRSQLLLNPKEEIAVVVMANASGVNTGGIAQNIFKIFKGAIKSAEKDTTEIEQASEQFNEFVGFYDSSPWWGEFYVFPWKNNLGLISFPAEDPVDGITELKHVEGNVFQRIRDDGEPGEEVIFVKGPDGSVAYLERHNTRAPRIEMK